MTVFMPCATSCSSSTRALQVAQVERCSSIFAVSRLDRLARTYPPSSGLTVRQVSDGEWLRCCCRYPARSASLAR